MRAERARILDFLGRKFSSYVFLCQNFKLGDLIKIQDFFKTLNEIQDFFPTFCLKIKFKTFSRLFQDLEFCGHPDNSFFKVEMIKKGPKMTLLIRVLT